MRICGDCGGTGKDEDARHAALDAPCLTCKGRGSVEPDDYCDHGVDVEEFCEECGY